MHNYKENQIDSGIVSVARNAGKLQDQIHALGFAILRVWHEAEDTGKASVAAAARLNALQNASPYHSNSFSKWVAKYTPCVWNKDEKSWVAHATKTTISKEVLKFAKAEPFYQLKPAPEAKPYDDIEAFLAYAESVEKKIKLAATKDDVVVHPEFVNALRELRRKVTAMEGAVAA